MTDFVKDAMSDIERRLKDTSQKIVRRMVLGLLAGVIALVGLSFLTASAYLALRTTLTGYARGVLIRGKVSFWLIFLHLLDLLLVTHLRLLSLHLSVLLAQSVDLPQLELTSFVVVLVTRLQDLLGDFLVSSAEVLFFPVQRNGYQSQSETYLSRRSSLSISNSSNRYWNCARGLPSGPMISLYVFSSRFISCLSAPVLRPFVGERDRYVGEDRFISGAL